MTEAEWLAATNPDRMLWSISGSFEAERLWVSRRRPSPRKWYLLGVACCRRVWEQIAEAENRLVVETVELFADGLVSDDQLARVAAAAVDCGYRVYHDPRLHRAYSATDALGRGVGLDATLEHSCSVAVGHAAYAVGGERRDEMQVQSHLIRDIFGNPFRPAVVDPRWLTETAVEIARGICDDRAFERLPILADALQDAGCEDAEVLSHCREPGTHVRGCWVIDLVLGKE